MYRISILSLFTLSNVHTGCKEGPSGIIELPRDKIRGWPIIPGSSIKGALRDVVSRRVQEFKVGKEVLSRTLEGLFGTQEMAGKVAFCDAFPLFYPIKSYDLGFILVTCPMAINVLLKLLSKEELSEKQLTDEENSDNKSLEFENRKRCFALSFHCKEDEKEIFVHDMKVKIEFSQKILQDPRIELALDLLRGAVHNGGMAKELEERAVLVSNRFFSSLLRFPQHFLVRNKVPDMEDPAEKNVWWEEIIPPFSLFVSPVVFKGELAKNMERFLWEFFERNPLLFLGGESSVGRGLVRIKLKREGL